MFAVLAAAGHQHRLHQLVGDEGRVRDLRRPPRTRRPRPCTRSSFRRTTPPPRRRRDEEGHERMSTKIEAGVLGATGTVGQEFIAGLADHPWFEVTWIGASERSAGKTYRDATPWRLPAPRPDRIAEMTVDHVTAGPGRAPKLLFSGLDASVAGEVEAAFAGAGHTVVTNARNHRMDPLVPLVIPEVNADHLALLDDQGAARGWSGPIVTNPNCSTIVLALALAPLRRFGLRQVIVSTLQAASGAGYPGVPSLDLRRQRHPRRARRKRRRWRPRRRRSSAGSPDGGVEPPSGDGERGHDAGARHQRPHRAGDRRPRRGARRRGDGRGHPRVPRPAAGARPARRPADARALHGRGGPPAAAARRRPRRRHDGVRGPAPPVPRCSATSSSRWGTTRFEAPRGRRC